MTAMTQPPFQKRIRVKANRFFDRFKAAILGRQKIDPVINDAKVAWHSFKMVSKNVESFLEGTPFKIPVAVLNTIIRVADSVIGNRQSTARRLSLIGRRLEMMSETLGREKHFESLYPTCQRFSSALTQAAGELEEMRTRGLLKRILEVDEDAADIMKIFEQVDEATKNFQLELTLANIRQTDEIKETVELMRLRNFLHPTEEVTYAIVEHEECTEGTRREILTRIMTWCKDTSPQSPPVFWLSGMAGTGKSTIAYTICRQLHGINDDARRLGASFFCSRQTRDGRMRRNIIPTICCELSISLPAFRREILQSKSDAIRSPLKDHIRNLLISPWAACARIDPSRPAPPPIPPLVVVIDALDELEKGEGSAFLAELIKEVERAGRDVLQGLKFFVTSRRDPRIVTVGNSTIPSQAAYRLEEVDPTFVEDDINLYLCAKLPEVDPKLLATLAHQAKNLFIYAATAVRFVNPPPPSLSTSAEAQKQNLELLLTSWPTRSQCSDTASLLVDHLYEEILNLWISPMAKDSQPASLAILQTIVCAKEPFILSDILELLDKPPKNHNRMDVDQVRNIILGLHAVLYVSKERVYSYHKSFIDFIFDQSRFVDAELAERMSPITSGRQYRLASSCFRLMDSLQFNMCRLPTSFEDDSKVADLPLRINNEIPTTLRYACRYWAAHFSKIPKDQRAGARPMFQKWLEQKLIFWMEAMNLIQAIGDCYNLLETIRESFNGQDTDIVAAQNLALSFASNIILTKSTPHLYISALASSSRKSHLMAMWRKRFPGIPVITALSSEDSNSLMLHQNNSVHAVSFSSHGRQVMQISTSNGGSAVHILDRLTSRELFEGSNIRAGIRMVTSSSDNTGVSLPSTSGVSEESMLDEQFQRQVLSHIHSSPGEEGAISGTSRNYFVDLKTVVAGPERSKSNEQHNFALCVATSFSPSGSRIVSALPNGVLCIWNTETGRQDCRIDMHKGSMHSVSFSPDEQHIAASIDRTVYIRDIETRRRLSCLTGHRNIVSSASFSPDASLVVSASHDRTLRIWDAETGKEILRIDAHDESVNSAGFSSDGKRIVSASDDGTVRVWDRQTGVELYRLYEHGSVSLARFSPDGTHIVSGSHDGVVRIWHAAVVKELSCIKTHGGRSVNYACFSPDETGTRIISASQDGVLGIWNTESGSQILAINAHSGVSVESACFSPDGTRVVSASRKGTVRVWDATTGLQIHHLTAYSGGDVHSVTFSPNGSRIVSASHDGFIRIWDSQTGRQMPHLKANDSGVLNSVIFSPDGTRIVSGSREGFVDIWDADTGLLIHHILACKEVYVNSAVFSQDGALIVAALHDGSIRVWDVDTGIQRYQLNGHDHSVSSASFSPDGKYVVSASYDGTIRIWEHTTQHQLYLLDGHHDSVSSVSFSQDGTKLVSSSYDGTVRTWCAPVAQRIQEIDAHGGSVNSVVFSPDGEHILSASSNDYSVKIWKVGSSLVTPISRLDHDSFVLSADYSPDGTHVVSASHNGTIRILDAKTGQTLRLLDTREDAISDSTSSPNASRSGRDTGDRVLSTNRYRSGEHIRLDGESILSSYTKGEFPSRLTISTTIGQDNKYADWRPDEDGWIKSLSGERYLWLSAEMHRFISPDDSLILSSKGFIDIDFTKSRLGPEWHLCYQPPSANL